MSLFVNPSFSCICSFRSLRWSRPSASPSNSNANLLLWCRFWVALNQPRQAATHHRRGLTIQREKTKQKTKRCLSESHPELEYTPLPVRLERTSVHSVLAGTVTICLRAARLPQSCTASLAGQPVWSAIVIKSLPMICFQGSLWVFLSEKWFTDWLGSCWDSSGSRGASVIDSSGAEARPLSADADALRTEMTPRHCLLPFMSSWCNFTG